MEEQEQQSTEEQFQASESGILKIIGKNLGDYHIVRLIAKGGMGIVYEAEQRSLNRKVALKILPNDLINEFISIERFKSEAQSIANLHHPNIVQVYQFSTWQNAQFFAMEYIEGKTLDEILRIKRQAAEEEGIPLLWALDIMIQVLKALDYAHSKGVVHRDIKPGNIMLDVSGRVFLTDFGLAKTVDVDKLEADGLTLGTPEYMSPEQAAGEPVDWRSDIYSIGLVLYEMITGEVPYQGNSPVSIIANRIVKEEVRRPREANPDIPEEVDRIIMRASAKQKSERYQSAREMAAALDKFRSEQKISEIVKNAAAKEKARAQAEIEKEKEKAQAVIMEEKIKATLQFTQEKRQIKQKELIKLLKIAVKASIFVSIVYLMMFLIYESNIEEDRIQKEVARKVIEEKRQEASEAALNNLKDAATLPDIPQELIVEKEPEPVAVPAETLQSKPAQPETGQEPAPLSRRETDWIQTQLQLGKNYEFVDRADLAIESYMKIIRKYPDSKYAEQARLQIRRLSGQSN